MQKQGRRRPEVVVNPSIPIGMNEASFQYYSQSIGEKDIKVAGRRYHSSLLFFFVIFPMLFCIPVLSPRKCLLCCAVIYLYQFWDLCQVSFKLPLLKDSSRINSTSCFCCQASFAGLLSASIVVENTVHQNVEQNIN